ncbi:MAG: hypothetical protein WB586_24030 [Chthoniobacterales bacterium]
MTDTEHGQWTEYEFDPYALALGCAPGFKPSPDGCSAALEVEDFDAAVSHLKQHDVKFRIEPMATPICRMAMILIPTATAFAFTSETQAVEKPNEERNHDNEIHGDRQSDEELGGGSASETSDCSRRWADTTRN